MSLITSNINNLTLIKTEDDFACNLSLEGAMNVILIPFSLYFDVVSTYKF